jgi:hypothetical protein
VPVAGAPLHWVHRIATGARLYLFSPLPWIQLSTDDRIEKLERFFKEVADLTFNHKVLADTAVV